MDDLADAGDHARAQPRAHVVDLVEHARGGVDQEEEVDDGQAHGQGELGAARAAARDEGAGYLPWMIAETDRPDYDGYLIRPERERSRT